MRTRNSDASFRDRFPCDDLRVLIVGRGPIRREAMDVFHGLGIEYGILLSENDSIRFVHTLAPELRLLKDFSAAHRIREYRGQTDRERNEIIEQILEIAAGHGYTHVFGGYGFMAEEADFIGALERNGIGFVGPSARVQHRAGDKDRARGLAGSLGIPLSPGVDNIAALTLLSLCSGSREKLVRLAQANKLPLPDFECSETELADFLLRQGYERGAGLITTSDLQREAERQVTALFQKHPGCRFRLKHVRGGGGKAQRVISRVEETAGAVLQILSEAQALGNADNKNFVIEKNLEKIRHHEIQLLGNGDWVISLGGRDCSLQRHEQKIVEFSLSDELFASEIENENIENRPERAAVLEKERRRLLRMEETALQFARAVKLDSASTFECLTAGDDFHFMEMNTRLQVEHRVTEQIYSLRFCDPDDPERFFEVDSLVEAMVLIAAHGSDLPQPQRIAQKQFAVEARLNAVDRALRPHPGGVIEYWSLPISGEIRDDQGIGLRNPDSGRFIPYRFAGAYDSNIALLVSSGSDRPTGQERLLEILRRMGLYGRDLKTNRLFLHSLLATIRGLDPLLQPTTEFVTGFLSLCGALAAESHLVDADYAWEIIRREYGEKEGEAAVANLDEKATLLLRPLKKLLGDSYLLAGWFYLGRNRDFQIVSGKIQWSRNPLRILHDLYFFLRLENRPESSPARQIWEHDLDLLQLALQFYRGPARQSDSFSLIDGSLLQPDRPGETADREDFYFQLEKGVRDPAIEDETKWRECLQAHQSWQLGMHLLGLPLLLCQRIGLDRLMVGPDLQVRFPRSALDRERHLAHLLALEKRPETNRQEILAPSAGIYYSRGSPDSAPFMEKGTRFQTGDPLFVLEVMKMFNTITATFSGTIEEVVVSGERGVAVKKGELLFRVRPDEPQVKGQTPQELKARRHRFTRELLEQTGR